MRVEIHVLQNFAPSNLNRDDAGSPKDAEFGGCRRLRISSQCQKRAVRKYFQERDLIPVENRAVRTKRLLDYASERLKKSDRDAAAVNRAVITALAAGGLKMDEKKGSETQYLLFLGEREISRFVALVDEYFDALAKEPEKTPDATAGRQRRTARQEKSDAKSAAPEEVRKTVPALLDGGKAADLALFGRMLADLPEKNVDAACQVAHAISTNQIHSLELDYFTAVDDRKEQARKRGLSEDAGAGMIETTAFNSACFYRYATLDVAGLLGGYRDEKKSLPFGLQGDAGLTRTSVAAFLQAFVHAVPTGKQNGFAAHNPPALVFTVVRDGAPASLANAFVRPVRPDDEHDLIEKSIHALDDFYGRLVRMYGDGGRKASFVCHMDGGNLEHLQEVVLSVAELIEKTTAAAFPAGEGA
jgi:CRISPR system Cascade subunit CasC